MSDEEKFVEFLRHYVEAVRLLSAPGAPREDPVIHTMSEVMQNQFKLRDTLLADERTK